MLVGTTREPSQAKLRQLLQGSKGPKKAMGLGFTFSFMSFWRGFEGPSKDRAVFFFFVQVCQVPEAQPARLPVGERSGVLPSAPKNRILLFEC